MKTVKRLILFSYYYENSSSKRIYKFEKCRHGVVLFAIKFHLWPLYKQVKSGGK